MNLLFFQFGDYGAAYRNQAESGPETYRDQKRSVKFVATLADSYQVTTAAVCDRPHDEMLAPNLRSIGISDAEAQNARTVEALLALLRPDLILLRTPNLHVLRWAKRRRVRTLPIFADLFAPGGLRRWLINRRAAALLAGNHISCVANHSLNASRSLVETLGVDERRVVPWDWSRLPVAPLPKEGPRPAGDPVVFFAGAISASKGVGDCLEAAAVLARRAMPVRFIFAGTGDLAEWRQRAETLGVADRVVFAGLLPHERVRAAMGEADLVVVPSRHEYAEGLPNTIYEALAARTPLIVSDHPAFTGRLHDDQDWLVFRAGDADDLANTIARPLINRDLYGRLSRNGLPAHDSLYVGMEWAELVTNFLADPANQSGWVGRNALAGL